MQPLLLAYVTSLAFSTVVATVLAVRVWRQHDRPGARWFVLALGSVAFWSGAQFVSTFQPTTAASMPFFKLTYVGAVVLVVALLCFTLTYTGRGYLVTPRLLALLAVEPAVVLALVFTTEQHTYVHDSIAIDPATGHLLAVDYTLGFYLHLAYSSVLLAVSTALLVQLAARARTLYRFQALAIVAAVSLPWAGSIADAVLASPVSYTEPAFAVSVIALWVGLFWYDLIDVPPVARAAVLETLSDGVFVVDRLGRLVDCNPAAKRLLSLDESDIGRQVTDLLADQPELRAAVEGCETPADTVAVSTPGGERTVEVTRTALERRGGHVFLLQDVTGRIERERELERQNARLDRFASVVSHDLRNPLNVAEGYVELLGDHVADREGRDYLEEVRTSHDRMDRIVDDVLALARSGDAVEEPDPVALADVVRDAWSQVDTADATLDCDVDLTVPADRGQLQRCFENLVRNAVEHAGPDVTVTVGELDGGDGFYVADDGPGIPEAERERVLDSGYSGGEGTGLGLAIVESVARAHGWTLAVTGSDEGGARFEFRGVTPVAEAEQAA